MDKLRERIAAFAEKWRLPEAAVEELLAAADSRESEPTTAPDPEETIDLDPTPANNQPWHQGISQLESLPPIPGWQKASTIAKPRPVSGSGTILPERYRDLGLLGMGGMGEVRRVQDVKLRRTLAMKIIHERMMNQPRMVSRFVEEAQVEAQLQHPNIVPVHDMGRLPEGRHYFTMKQIRGTEFGKKIVAVHQASLEDRWKPAVDGTNFRDLIRILQTVCETMAYAHAQGVIHRDLKPENIMIGGFGEVLVVDWGLAKVLDRDETAWEAEAEEWLQTDRSSSSAHQTHMGSVSGTPCYMAPEQAFGRTNEVGKPTDVYTLGAILYELLSGNPPYDGDNAQAVLDKVKSSAPFSLRTTDVSSLETHDPVEKDTPLSQTALHVPINASNKIPNRLVEICEAAMIRSIESRTITAQQMADEIKAWLEGAEKRDKGLAEVARANDLVKKAEQAEDRAAKEWMAADDLIRRKGVQFDAAWAHWAAHREAHSEARRLRRRHERSLQAALVHAPDLDEAHEALALLRIDELLEAAAVGDRAHQEALSQQLSAHLAALPTSISTPLEEQIQHGRDDIISGHRYRRGTIVGRHEQRTVVGQRIEDGARLLTLLGTAGVGKTRIALELAEDHGHAFGHTVFCDLTEATDAIDVALHLSRALDTRLRDKDPVGHLSEVLAQQPTLLILDNLEQLSSIIGPLCAEWLEHAPKLMIVATSRTRLGVNIETVVPIQPMSILESIDLFIRRGQVIDQRFDLNEDNRQQLCELMAKLDGLPLAIELAAARLNLFTLDELAERLNERFSLLRSRGRDAQALDGALDWSWGLLEPWAKAALSQASLFRGGFTLAAAEGVIDVGEDRNAPAMFDILGDLVDNSLLRKDQSEDEEVRYSLLESIRAYASYKLGYSGEMSAEIRGPEAQQAAQHRHAQHFSQMGTTAALKALDGFDSNAKWDALFRDLDNLLEGIGYGTVDTASRCCLAALKILGMKGPVSLGVDIASKVLQMQGIGKREQMLIEIERSKCLRISGRMQEARAMVSSSTATLSPDASTDSIEASNPGPEDPEDEEDPTTEVTEPPTQGIATTLLEAEHSIEKRLSDQVQEPNKLNSRLRAEDGLRIPATKIQPSETNTTAETEPDNVLNQGAEITLIIDPLADDGDGSTTLSESDPLDRIEAERLMEVAGIEHNEGNLDGAFKRMEMAVRLYQKVGDKEAECKVLGTMAFIHKGNGALDQAIQLFEQSVAMAKAIDHKGLQAKGAGSLALLYQNRGQVDRAISSYNEAIALSKAMGNQRHEAHHLGNLGTLYHVQGQNQRAFTHFSKALSVAREIGDKQAEAVQLGNLGSLYYYSELEYEKSYEHLNLAITIHRNAGNKSSEAICLSNIASTLQSMGRNEEAELLYRDSISLGDEFMPVSAGSSRGNLALLLAQRGEHNEAAALIVRGEIQVRSSAEDHCMFLCKKGEVCLIANDIKGAKLAIRHAVGIATALHVTENSSISQAVESLKALLVQNTTPQKDEKRTLALIEAERLLELGTLEQQENRYNEGRQCIEKAFSLFREHLDPKGESQALGYLGDIEMVQGHYEKAITNYNAAIRIAQDNHYGQLEGQHLGNLGNVYDAQGRHDEALQCYKQAIGIAEKNGDQRFVGVHLVNMANVHKGRGQFEESILHYKKATNILRQVGDTSSLGICLGNLGDALVKVGQTGEAEKNFRSAIEIGDMTSPITAGVFRGSLALLLTKTGAQDEAITIFEAGKQQLQTYPSEYAKFICKQGRAQHLRGNTEAARSSLSEAQALAGQLNVTRSSELRQAIRSLAEVLDSKPKAENRND